MVVAMQPNPENVKEMVALMHEMPIKILRPTSEWELDYVRRADRAFALVPKLLEALKRMNEAEIAFQFGEDFPFSDAVLQMRRAIAEAEVD